MVNAFRKQVRILERREKRIKEKRKQERPRSSKFGLYNSWEVIPIKVWGIFCVGLIHPHTNLFQFSSPCVYFMLEVKFLKKSFEFLLIELLTAIVG